MYNVIYVNTRTCFYVYPECNVWLAALSLRIYRKGSCCELFTHSALPRPFFRHAAVLEIISLMRFYATLMNPFIQSACKFFFKPVTRKENTETSFSKTSKHALGCLDVSQLVFPRDTIWHCLASLITYTIY